MVFSFFKKQPEKMPERPAARPRAPQAPQPELAKPVVDLPDLIFSNSQPVAAPPPAPKAAPPSQPVPSKKVAAPAPAPILTADSGDEFDLDFSESRVMAIDVSNDSDPLQADIEQVVVLYANGQDAIARSLLESFIPIYPGESGQRFWFLLFDLLEQENDRPAYDKLSLEFVKTYEISPPTWREPAARVTQNTQQAGPPKFALQGKTRRAGLLCILRHAGRGFAPSRRRYFVGFDKL